MPVKIRLARGGAKKSPFYRLVIADARAPRDGSFIEKVGTYSPLLEKDNSNRITLKEDRVRHWLSKGAQPTERVIKFIANHGGIPLPKRMLKKINTKKPVAKKQ